MTYPTNASSFPSSVMLNCPVCSHLGYTVVSEENGSATWCWCAVLSLTIGCCCIPFFMQSCKDILHRCSFCGSQVGYYKQDAC